MTDHNATLLSILVDEPPPEGFHNATLLSIPVDEPLPPPQRCHNARLPSILVDEPLPPPQRYTRGREALPVASAQGETWMKLLSREIVERKCQICGNTQKQQHMCFDQDDTYPHCYSPQSIRAFLALQRPTSFNLRPCPLTGTQR